MLNISNTFSQPSNDNYNNAIDVTSLINNCSADEAFTTVGATPDLNVASCWTNGGPIQNVWFKFTAPESSQINITIDISGTKGTQRRTQLALWESDGITEITCKVYSLIADDVTIGKIGLTVGSTYYFSVDTYQIANDGTFTLCINDKVDYDYYEGAVDVSHLINYCSEDAVYNSKGATPDKNAGSCWNNGGPVQNRWFKFQASDEYMAITVAITGTKGTQRRTELALWEMDGLTQIACERYIDLTDNVTTSSSNLTPGNWYYFSVDTYSSNNDGSFSICMSSFIPLSLEGNDFQVKNRETGIELTWENKKESKNSTFIIEKSGDGKSFETHSQFENSFLFDSIQTFLVIDEKPFLDLSYYRLIEVDPSGNETTSEIKSVNRYGNKEINVFPNPIGNITQLEIQGKLFNGQFIEVVLINSLGQKVLQEFYNEVQHQSKIKINLPHQLPDGIYFLQLNINDLIIRKRIEKI
jgi:hypothetical protein